MLLRSVHVELSLDLPAGLDVGQSPKEVYFILIFENVLMKIKEFSARASYSNNFSVSSPGSLTGKLFKADFPLNLVSVHCHIKN